MREPEREPEPEEPPFEPGLNPADSLDADLAFVEEMMEAEKAEEGGGAAGEEEYVDDPLAGIDWDD